MVASPVQLDTLLTGVGLAAGLPPISTIWAKGNFIFLQDSTENGQLGVLRHEAKTKAWCTTGQASTREEETPPHGGQEFLWPHFFSNPTQWWDEKPVWVDAGVKRLPNTVCTSVQGALKRLAAYERGLELRMCKQLCEDGQITDAVETLNLLVQRGCHVPSNLYYFVLKRCMAQKDLVLGRRIHALTVKSGYEGDAFLATHLITLYASHGTLEEAMRVFAKVSVPSAHNWATIIIACARHGEPTQAIRLYEQMREAAAVQPDNYILSAVIKACASAGDLAAGKDVHAHVLASAGTPDIVVQTCLVDMYAKCGSIEDARRVFDTLPHKNVVTWTAMISGYAQQGMGQEALTLYTCMDEEGFAPPNSVTFICLLQACASVGEEALHHGKQLHEKIEERGLQDDVVVGGSLVNMYAKCGSVGHAREVFDRLPHRNVVTWNAMLAGYAQEGMGQEALSLYSSMQQEAVAPSSVTFVSVLQACASLGGVALDKGKKLHVQIEEQGLQNDMAVGGSLVNMYVKCSSIADARRVFDNLPHRGVATWNGMIAGYAQQGMCKEALNLYSSMQQEATAPPDTVTYVCLLQACSTVGEVGLHHGKQLHVQIEEEGLQDDVVVGGSLVTMYAKCGSLVEARMVFDRLLHRNVVTWTAMIAGYVQQGVGKEALSLYSGMQKEGVAPHSSATFVCLLQACAIVGEVALHQGKQLHAQIEERGLEDNVIVGGSLVNMYAKCGSIEAAREVFDKLLDKNVMTWNAMIAGYVQQGMRQEAFSLYSTMQQESITPPGSVTFVCLLQACACAGPESLQTGKQLHAHIEEQRLQDDVVVGGSLINMYAKCGSLDDSRQVFDTLTHKNVVTWNTMLAGYAQHGMGQEALSLYRIMQHECILSPNFVTFVSLLQACVGVGVDALHQGKQLHAQIEARGLQGDVVIGNSLVTMYAKCGSIEDARRVFERVPRRDVVTWTAMIAGYAQQRMGQEALHLYTRMQQEGITTPDSVMFLCLLQACATAAALPLGKQLHAQIEQQGLQADLVVGSGLVDMYAKCGSMVDSHQVFDSLPERNMEAWSALIAGYTRQGNSEAVFNLLDRMRLEGIQPDAITFLSVMTVCSHVGLLDKGRKYFEAMSRDYGISPAREHYTCMIGLLGRAGYLEEALEMAKTMPFQPNGAAWHTLLGACRKWSNVELAQEVFKLAVGLNERDAASYVLMSNIYAEAQMWEEAKEMQARRVNSKAWKQPGQSWWTDVGGVVHSFLS